MGNFYTYVLCDPRKPETSSYENFTFAFEPFYVGKGTKRRAWRHANAIKHGQVSDNPHRDRLIRKILKQGMEPVVVVISSSLSEEAAFQLEQNLIRVVGRSNTHQGPLTNLSEGGEGNAGYRWTETQRKALLGKRSGAANPFFKQRHTDEAKARMSQSHYDCSGPNNPFYEKTHTEETKRLISEKNLGRVVGPFSEEHRKNISTATLGKKKTIQPEASEAANRKRSENMAKYGHPSKRIYLVSMPSGTIIEVKGLKRWCLDSGVNYHMLLLTARGKRKDWNGYSCTIKTD